MTKNIRAGDRAAARWRTATAAAAERIRGRGFTGLTVVVVTVSILAHVIDQDAILHQLAIAFAMSVLLVFAMRTVGPRFRVVIAMVAAPALIGQWTTHVAHSPIPRSVVLVCTTAFFALLTLVILFAVLRSEITTADTLVGGVCAYFLLAATWGSAYGLLAWVSPEAFSIAPSLASTESAGSPTGALSPLFQYYSFSALTTLTFGDISPLSRGARALTMLEGVTGQLYLAMLIGRLIGLNLAPPER